MKLSEFYVCITRILCLFFNTTKTDFSSQSLSIFSFYFVAIVWLFVVHGDLQVTQEISFGLLYIDCSR